MVFRKFYFVCALLKYILFPQFMYMSTYPSSVAQNFRCQSDSLPTSSSFPKAASPRLICACGVSPKFKSLSLGIL